jgi:serine/threonine-protein kinase
MQAGTQVGAYRVLERLGAGGMGEVWLAEHTKLGRRAAIKVLHRGMSSQPEIVSRFFNEARAATAIADPGIVQVFDFGEHGGNSYIVMELLDGEALDKRLQRVGALQVADALRITRQVASSLDAAHARGIVHRDLKPENVFLVRDAEVIGGERAKILDFGIAKLGAAEGGLKTQTSALMGTPTYMSPEQCRGAGLVDRRSDIYSLGCVLYHLIVGKPPFESEGVGELIAMHLREPPPRASSRATGVPPDVDALIARCLEKDPANRFQTARELAQAIGTAQLQAPAATARVARPEPRQAVAIPVENQPRGTTLSSAAAENGGLVTDVESPARTGRGRAIAVIAGLAVAAGAAALILLRGGPAGPQAPAASAPGPAALAPAAAPSPLQPAAPVPHPGPPAPEPSATPPPPAPAPAPAVVAAPARAPETPPTAETVRAAAAPSRGASKHASKKPGAHPRKPAGGDDDIPDSR